MMDLFQEEAAVCRSAVQHSRCKKSRFSRMLPPDFFPKGYSQSPVRRIADKAFEKEPVGPLPHIGQRRMKHLLVPKKLVNSQDLETCDSPTIPVRTRDQKEVHYEHKTIEKDRDSGMNVSKQKMHCKKNRQDLLQFTGKHSRPASQQQSYAELLNIQPVMRNSSSNIRTRVVLTRRNSCSESSAKKNGKAIDSQQALLHDIRSSLNEICKSGKEARGTSRRMGKGKTGDKQYVRLNMHFDGMLTFCLPKQ